MKTSNNASNNASHDVPTAARWMLALLACLALGACKEQRDPVKPTTDASAIQVGG